MLKPSAETMVIWQKSTHSGNGGNCVEVTRAEQVR